MCGIVGQALARRSSSPDPRMVRAAVAVLRHRGPDDEGVFEAAGIFFGPTRLSITGVVRGHQPLSDEKGGGQGGFYGGIYNPRERRGALDAPGARVDGDVG